LKEGEILAKKSEIEKTNFRFNLLTTIVYIVGIILLVQLFNLQIIHGAEYRNTSNTKLSREVQIEATRGKIYDRTGTILADTKMGFNVQLFKTKVSEKELNNGLLVLSKILESNKDTYIDNLPIKVNPYKYTIEKKELDEFKNKNGIDSAASAEEAFLELKEKYEIDEKNPEDARRILTLRYSIDLKGYTATKPIQVASNISRKSAIQIEEQSEKLAGITIDIESQRVYPHASLASHIVGYMGKITEDEYNNNKETYTKDSRVGRTGIENIFEDYLRGEIGYKEIDMSVDGTVTGEYTTKEAVGGSSIVLTIDANLQYITEKALEKNIKKIKTGGFNQKYNAQGGAAVVLNVKSGEVLAMASYPDYNPSDFLTGISKEKLKSYNKQASLLNRAIQGTYAPGSIFKMVTAIAGLQEGKISTTSTVYDTGVYPRANHPVCWIYTSYHVGHGRVNVSSAIEKSCNYFFYDVGYKLGVDKLAKYAKSFGLGLKTGIELPYESAGTVASNATAESKGEKMTEGGVLSAAIGQSYNDFTPLQIAKYIAMVANRGKAVNPTIVKEVIGSDGKKKSANEINSYISEKAGLTDENITKDLKIDSKNIKAVLRGMRSVTSDDGGTAADKFRGFNISVAGKTGSAEAGSYVNAWFVGFAPYNNPEIAVVVLVENGGHGNYTAEVVRDIIAEYFGMNTKQIKESMSAPKDTETYR